MWPSEYIELKQIEDLLICGICYDYMDTSVMTPCSHNYCSLCIRKYLHYKTQCPACFENTFEQDLRTNKAIDQIISYYSKFREKLLKCLQKEKSCMLGDIKLNVATLPPVKVQPASISNTMSPSTSRIGSPITSKVISPSLTKVKNVDLSSPSTKPRMISFFTPKSKKQEEVVNCPVCKVNVSKININRHLDDCLERESLVPTQSSKNGEKRKPLSKLVFSVMKDVELRRKLKEFGLQSVGDRKCLETRLQRYITLYNAECDKPNPRSVAELIKQCKQEEELENQVQKTVATHKMFVNRSAPEDMIDHERKKYLQIYKSSFEELIAKAKSTENAKKSINHSMVNQNSDHTDVNKCNVTNDIQSMDGLTEKSQESDSDSSLPCPLQIYSSENRISNATVNGLYSSDKEDQIKLTPENRSQSPILSNLNLTKSPSFSHARLKTIRDKRNFAFGNKDIHLPNTPKRPKNSTSFTEILESDSDTISDNEKCLLQLKSENEHSNVCSTSMNRSMSAKLDEKDTVVSSDYDSDEITYDYEKLNDEIRIKTTEINCSPQDVPSSKLEKENLIELNKRNDNNVIRKRSNDSFNDDNVRKKRHIKKTKAYEAEFKDLNYDTLDEDSSSEKSLTLRRSTRSRQQFVYKKPR